jgi:hypothetical protein
MDIYLLMEDSMKRTLMASVLLASMVFTIPVYADSDVTPDEYNSYDKYASPVDQSYGPVVNDYPKTETADDSESERFTRAAGQMMQRTASGKIASERQQGSRESDVDSEQNTVAVHETKNRKEEKKDDAAAARQVALEKAEKQAEEILSETDDNYEPDQDKKYPGKEYQAHRQVMSGSKTENAKSNQQKDQKTGLKSAELKNASIKDVPFTAGNTKNTLTQDSLSKNERRPVSSNAAKNKAKGEKSAKKQPVIIQGNDAQYASESGDFIIEGNVSLVQGSTKVYSTKAVGNEKTGDIWLLEGGTLREPTNTVNTRWAHYNFNKETGELLHIQGASRAKVGSNKHDYYEAPHGLIEHGMLIMDQGGMTTRCPAVKHSPCLAVKAKTITIIPNDRIIARKVQVFVKGKHVYSRDVWINDLKKKSNQINPHIGWSENKGWYVSVDYQRPIGNPLLKNPTTFYMKQVYYTKSKYKPFYGISHDRRDFNVRLNSGYVYDSDDDRLDEGRWLHKKVDWGLFVKPHRIAKGIPLVYDASLTHGLWKYNDRNWQSWRTEGIIRLRHDRIYPLGGKKLYLDLMLGRKWIHESLDNATTRRYGNSLHTNIYHGTLGYRFSNKWNIWGTYHREHKTDYLFSLGQPSFTNEFNYGVSWSPDKLNTFTIVNQYNADSGSRTHGNYTTTFRWSHRFCCEVISVSYQKKHYNGKHEWKVFFDLLSW